MNFTPQPLRLWGIVITRGGQAVGRAVRNSALTETLADDFFWHQAISGHFPRRPSKKLVGTITYESLIGLHSKLVWLFSRYF